MKLERILGWLKSSGYDFVFSGDDQVEIDGFSSLLHYRENSLTWIKREENYSNAGQALNIACGVVQSGVKVNFKNKIVTDNSKEIFFSILHEFWGEKEIEGVVGEGTVISDNVSIDPTAIIGCNCSIAGNVVIGAHTVIENNVVIQGRVQIGRNCHIQSLASIGISGFGYSQEPGTKKKTMIEHFGGVCIGDDVFIGSHVNIARGTIDDTMIGNRVKIAPSTHIGHNNVIEDDTAVICATLYGSVKIGKGSYITASTIENQMTIGDNTVIGMGSVVTKPIGDNVIAYGIPAKSVKENDSGL